MRRHPNVESFTRFVEQWLPGELEKLFDVGDYCVEETAGDTCSISLTVRMNGEEVSARFCEVPFPRRDGSFLVEGTERAVLMAADRADLANARVRCVGEQLGEEIGPRLQPLPEGVELSSELLAAWLPIDKWINDFLLNSPTSQVIEADNWLARQAYLRRLVLPEDDAQPHPSQIGRACPLETPEGPNCGRILHLATGAEVREGKVVVVNSAPTAALGLTASMVPLIEHDEANRALMGVNMMRQWLRLPEPEAALVQTGNEPEEDDFWAGRNLLTAFIHYKGLNYEDGIVVSRSCAERLASPDPLETGDKLSNRHGAKGVVAAILPDEQMPQLEDGRPVDVIFDFIGMHTRCNFGQVREAVLGNIAQARGTPVVCPPFGAPDADEIRGMLRECGLDESGQTRLIDGDGGAAFAQPATVGYVYWGKTYHRARPKLVRWMADGVPSRGCMQGELETYAMRTCGAYHNIIETYCLRSVERPGVERLGEEVAAGPVAQAQPPSPAFTKLRSQLCAAGISIDFDGECVRFGFAAPGPDDLELSVGTGGDAEDTPADLSLKASLVQRNQVAFSARAVLAPGPELKLGQVGLPEEMAWGLFEPLVARRIGHEEAATHGPEARKALDAVMAENVVLLNRAPTMEPTCLTAFVPVVTDGPAIRLHPMCCRMFNGDFDGDQAAVFLPITEAAQEEAKAKLTVQGHLERDPGTVITHLAPDHCILWGLAHAAGDETMRDRLRVSWPEALPQPPQRLTRAWLINALCGLMEASGADAVTGVLDELKELGIGLTTQSGASISPFIGRSLRLPPRPGNRYAWVWRAYATAVESAIVSQADVADPEMGPQLLAVESEARGNISHLRQLIGPRGVPANAMADSGVVTGGFVEGIDADEYMGSVVGARRGLQALALGLGSACHGLRESMGAQTSSVPARADSVLRRAMSAARPGEVFAAAAAAGEVDPLTDTTARLFMGMLPRDDA